MMRGLVVSGAVGKDVHVKIDSIRKLPPPFRKYIRKSIAYSRIPEFYGSEWNIDRVMDVLKNRAVEPITYSYGGRSSHVAYGVARLGGKVKLVTVFGDDLHESYDGFFGGGYWKHLTRAGVEMSLLKVSVPDEVWRSSDQLEVYLKENYGDKLHEREAVLVHGKETPTIVCCKDLNNIDFFYIDDVKGASYVEVARPAPRKVLKDVDMVFVTTSEPQFMERVVKTSYELGKEVLMDVGSYGVSRSFLKSTVPFARVIFGNPGELKQVCDAFDVKELEEVFDVTGTKLPEIIVLEEKHEGYITLITKSGESTLGPIPLNKTGNSVGCCDGMAAGFLAFYQRGLSPELCAKAGLALCSTIWEVEGVQEGIPDKRGFYERFSRLFSGDAELISDFLKS